jgi:hypothetical protein
MKMTMKSDSLVKMGGGGNLRCSSRIFPVEFLIPAAITTSLTAVFLPVAQVFDRNILGRFSLLWAIPHHKAAVPHPANHFYGPVCAVFPSGKNGNPAKNGEFAATLS